MDSEIAQSVADDLQIAISERSIQTYIGGHAKWPARYLPGLKAALVARGVELDPDEFLRIVGQTRDEILEIEGSNHDRS